MLVVLGAYSADLECSRLSSAFYLLRCRGSSTTGSWISSHGKAS